MKTKLATINLQVANPERSKRFYLDVLGMVEDTERSHAPVFIYLQSNGCDITLATPQEAHGAQPSRTIELGFEVDDIAAMKTHLSACGVRNYREESMGWDQALELRDNDRYQVLIYSLKGHSR